MSATRQLPFSPDHLAVWREWLAELVRIPSDYECEGEILQYLEQHLRARNIEFIRVPFGNASSSTNPHAQPPLSTKPDRYNVVVSIKGRRPGPTTVVNAHLDTVPAGSAQGWTFPPYDACSDERGAMFGRGVMDDKAGVVIALALISHFHDHPEELQGCINFHFVLEDETTGNGSLLCLDAGYGGDAALILDGTRGDKAINQHAGNLQFCVEVVGKSASVSVSHLGINACEHLAVIITRMKALFSQLNQNNADPWSQFPSPNQVSAQKIESEYQMLSVSPYAAAQFYATFTPPLVLSDIRARIVEFVNQYAATELPQGCVARAKFGMFETEPVCAEPDAWSQLLVDCAKSAAGWDVVIAPSTGTSDLRHFARQGIPCLLFGPGRGFNPHRFDEHYFVEDLVPMANIVYSLVGAWGMRSSGCQ